MSPNHDSAPSAQASDVVLPGYEYRPGVMIEEGGLIRYVDDRYAQAFGYRSPSSLIGKHISIVIASEDQGRLLSFGKKRVQGDAAPRCYEFKGKRSDGVDIGVDVTVQTLTHEGRVFIASQLASEPFELTPPPDLELIYQQYSPTIYAFLLRMLRSEADACDALQETFLQAWKQLDRFHPSRATVCGWLLMIARTRALDRIRAARTRGRYESAAGTSLSEQETFSILSLDAARAKKALGTIPPDQRQVLELAYFEDLSHSEIAARLAIPLGTVKTRISLGMRKLRELVR